MMNKVTNTNAAIYIKNRLEPPLRQVQHMHSLSFIIPSCKTQYY